MATSQSVEERIKAIRQSIDSLAEDVKGNAEHKNLVASELGDALAAVEGPEHFIWMTLMQARVSG